MGFEPTTLGSTVRKSCSSLLESMSYIRVIRGDSGILVGFGGFYAQFAYKETGSATKRGGTHRGVIASKPITEPTVAFRRAIGMGRHSVVEGFRPPAKSDRLQIEYLIGISSKS
jgi:hypothetical protein